MGQKPQVLGGRGVSSHEHDTDADGGEHISPESVDTEYIYNSDREPDVVVREDGSDVVAVGSGGEVDRGSDPIPVIQSALDSAPDRGYVYVEGSYTPDGANAPIQWGSGKILGGPAYFDWQADFQPLFQPTGTKNVTQNAQSDVNEGDTTISVSDASDFSADDLVLVEDNTDFNANRTGNTEGEVHYIRSVDTGADTILLDQSIFNPDGYATADSASVTNYTPVEAHLRGFTIEGTDPTSADHVGVKMDRTIDSTVKDVTLKNLGRRGIHTELSYDLRVFECTLDGVDNDPSLGYGFACTNANTNVLVKDSTFRRCTHAVVSGGSGNTGQTMGLRVVDNKFTAGNSHMVDTHDVTWSVVIDGNWFGGSGVQECVDSGALRTVVTNNTAYDSSLCSTRGSNIGIDYVIEGNTVYNGRLVQMNNLNSNQQFNRVAVNNNNVEGNGLFISNGAQDPTVKNFSFQENTVIGGKHGCYANKIEHGQISDNVFRKQGANAVRLDNCQEVQVLDNKIRTFNVDNAFAGESAIVFRDSTSDCRAEGNRITDPNGNGDHAIEDDSGTGADNNAMLRNDIKSNDLAASALVPNTNTRVEGNNGHSTSERGSETLSSGNTETSNINVNVQEPLANDSVQVTPVDDLGNATYWYLTAVANSYFRIGLDADPGQDVEFAWEVNTDQ